MDMTMKDKLWNIGKKRHVNTGANQHTIAGAFERFQMFHREAVKDKVDAAIHCEAVARRSNPSRRLIRDVSHGFREG
jgi:hypothetical protein